MKKHVLRAAGLLLLAGGPARAQPAPAAAGHIRYEITRRLDGAKIITRDGAGSQSGALAERLAELPDVVSTGVTLAYGPAFARELRETTTVQVLGGGDGGHAERPTAPGPGVNLGAWRPSFAETTYANLAARTQIRVLAVGQGAQTTRYRTEEPYATPADWRETGRRKTIAGLPCREAKATLKGRTYAAWFTTALPFTYSPLREVAPPQGVVLLLESDHDQYRAVRLDAKPVAAAELQPPADARPVSPAELADARQQAQADYMRQLVDGLGQAPATKP